MAKITHVRQGQLPSTLGPVEYSNAEPKLTPRHNVGFVEGLGDARIGVVHQVCYGCLRGSNFAIQTWGPSGKGCSAHTKWSGRTSRLGKSTFAFARAKRPSRWRGRLMDAR